MQTRLEEATATMEGRFAVLAVTCMAAEVAVHVIVLTDSVILLYHVVVDIPAGGS
jgi:hypothetical protein